MPRALSVILIMWFLTGSVLAENVAAPSIEQARPAAVAQIGADCGDGPGSGGCNAMCAPCGAIVGNAVVQFSPLDFRGLPSMPASRFADAVRAPEAAPPKHLLS